MARPFVIRFIYKTCMLAACIILALSCEEETFSPSRSGSFMKHFGTYLYDEGSDIIRVPDGGYAFTGNTVTDDYVQKIVLYRTDRYGNPMWDRKIFGGSYLSSANRIIVLRDGGFAILGNTYADTKHRIPVSNMYLVRTDAWGNTMWTKSYGGFSNETGYDLVETADRGLLLVGKTEDFEKERTDVIMIRTDHQGDTLWTRRYGGPGNDAAISVAATQNGFVFAGYSRSFAQPGQAGLNILVAKVNQLGRITYPFTYGGAGNDSGVAITPAPAGGYYLLGTTTDPATRIKNIFLTRIQEDISAALWTKTIGGAVTHTASGFRVTPEGDVVITGTQEISDVNHAIFLIKIDAAGNEVFSKTYGGTGKQRAAAIELSDDGGYVIIGSSEQGGNSMITLLKTKADGTL